MNQLIKTVYDKVLVAIAGAGLAVSCLWVGQQQGALRRLRSQPVAAVLSGAAYAVTDRPAPDLTPAVWPPAVAQSGGPGWLYDVFTPPVIYYNPLAKSFTVSLPTLPPEDATAFGVELVAVKQELYRLQLVGYAGDPGDYRIAFERPGHPETLLVRAGDHLAGLGLTLRRFAVTKVPVPHDDPWPVFDVAALAVLQDDRTGAEVVLDNRRRKFTGAPLAVLQVAGTGAPRECHEGDSFSGQNSTYRIERIQLTPPEVVVARQASGSSRTETRVLHPASAAAGALPSVAHLTDTGPSAGLPAPGP